MRFVRETLHAPSPTKRPASYGAGRDEYIAWSVKSGRVSRLYSAARYQWWLLKDWDPQIEALCEDPDSGVVPLAQGRTRQLALWTRAIGGRECFWDVATDREIKELDTPSRAPAHWPAVETWARHHGCGVELVTSRTLAPYRQRLENLMQLHPLVAQAQADGRATLEDEVLKSLRVEDPITLDELVGLFADTDSVEVLSAAAALMYRGAAVADLDKAPVGRALKIRRTGCGSPAAE